MTILDTRMSSTIPPRPRLDFNRIPRSVSWKIQFEMVILRILPLISLPNTTPPCPWTIVQFVIVIFSQAILSYVSSVPALIAIQSSPTSIWQLLIRTFCRILDRFRLYLVNLLGSKSSSCQTSRCYKELG